MVQVYFNQAFDALLGVIYDAPPMAKLLSVIKNQIMCQTLVLRLIMLLLVVHV
jgi:hypothetical protein